MASSVSSPVLCECGCGLPAPIARQTHTQFGWIKGQPLRFRKGHWARTKKGRKTISQAQSGREVGESTRAKMSGEKNPRWVGDDVRYGPLHNWLRRHKQRTGVCEECKVKGPTDFANISGEYRRDVDDFIELCRRCHVKFDKARSC